MDKAAIVFGGILLLASLIYVLLPQMTKVPIPDESTFIYEGWRIRQGAVPYRDFFEFVGPVTLYHVAIVTRLFGLSLLALRLSAVLEILLGLLLTFRLSMPLLPPAWRWWLIIFLLGMYLPGSFVIQHHIDSAVLGLLAVWLLSPRSGAAIPTRRLVSAGLATGLCLLCTQSLGGLLGLALTAFLLPRIRFAENLGWPEAFKRLSLGFLLPALLPVSMAILYFASQGALSDFGYDTVGWLLQGSYARTTSHWYLLDGFTRLVSHLASWSHKPVLLFQNADIVLQLAFMLLQGFLPVLGLLWGAQALAERFPHRNLRPQWDRLTPGQWHLLLLLLAGLAFFGANFSYPNTVLVLYHGWLQYILAFAALYSLCGRYARLGDAVRWTVIILIFSQLAISAREAWPAYNLPGIRSYGTVEKQLSPVGNTAESVAGANALLAFLHEQSPPGESLFIYNGAPEFYLLTARRNPTRYQILMTLYNTPAQIAEAQADLARKQPEFILYNQVDALDFEKDLRFIRLRHYDYRLHGLEQLLAEHYIPAARLENIIVFRRLPSPP